MNDRSSRETDKPAETAEQRAERLRRLGPSRIEIITWGGFEPPWKKGPITEALPPRSE